MALRIFSWVAVCVAVEFGVACGSPDEPKRDGLPTGKWTFESQTIGGRELSDESRADIWIEIIDGSFFRCGKAGLRAESKLSSDPTRSPKEFQLEFTHPVTKKVSITKGIYKIEGARLTLCYDNSGKGRPTEFKSPEGKEEIVLSILQRKKE